MAVYRHKFGSFIPVRLYNVKLVAIDLLLQASIIFKVNAG